jgi:hypothetical protein
MPVRVRVFLLSLTLLVSSRDAAADPPRALESGRQEIEAGDYEDAAVTFRDGLAEAREEKSHPSLILALLVELADVYMTYPDLGKEADAEALLVEARAIAESTLPAGDRSRVVVLERLGTFYSLQDRQAEVIPVLEAFMTEAEPSIPPERLYRSEPANLLRAAYSRTRNAEGVARIDRMRDEPTAMPAPPDVSPRAVDPGTLYVEPNAHAADGTPITVHFDPKTIPLRVSVPLPDTPAADATPEQTREAAIQGMREWESAIRKLQPEFRIAFEDANAGAPIQVKWSDRPPGYVGGYGQIRAVEADGAWAVTAQVILSAKPLPGRGEVLPLGEVEIQAMHAFGGALGLGYCWECDSIRSMGWRHREQFFPTDLDVRTYEALLAVPVGTRGASAPSEPGVLADLPFINTGDDRHIFVDMAKPGSADFVVQLDTGATATIVTPVYARALGVATRSAKSDANRRESVTGDPLLFWVTTQYVVGGSEMGWSYALLGGEYLSKYVVEIDYGRRRVRFLDPRIHRVGADPPERSGEQVVPMPVSELRPYVEIGLGNGAVRALVDTGSMGAISISDEMAAKLGIAVDPKAPRRQWRNVLGTSVSAMQRVPVVKLGPLTLEDVGIDIGLRDEGGVRVERIFAGEDEALIGQVLLRDFVVRFDYPRKKLGLTPVAR